MTILPAAPIFSLALLGIGSAVVAPVTRADPRDEIIYSLLEHFWGHAKDAHGQLIQPTSEGERSIVPIPMPVARRALEAGEASGFAEWCGVEWEPHYFSITKSARSHEMSDTQIAFISVLHGAAQGAFVRSAQGATCSQAMRAEAEERLSNSVKLGLPRYP